MPNRIDELFFEKHRVERATLENLDKEEVEELRRIALDRPDNPNRVRALGFLTQLEDRAALDAARRILTNAEENADVRAAAASLAARFGSDAEPALLESIAHSRESLVRRRIAASLGESGGRKGIEALRELANDDDESVRSQAEFSMSVLAARDGLDEMRLPIPARDDILEPRPGAAQPFTVDRASLDEATRVLQALERRTFGVAVSRDGVFAVSCERDQMMIAVDERLSRPDFTERVASRPSIPALVLAPAPDDDTYSVRWIVFSWPATAERFHLAVHRPSGQQILFGEAFIEARSVAFVLESVRGSGRLAIRFTGRLIEDRIEVREAIASRLREPANVPRAFQLPGLSGGQNDDGESLAHDASDES